LLALDGAVDYWLQVFEANSNDPDPAISIANVRMLQSDLHRQLGQYDQAKAQLNEAIRILLSLQPHLPKDHRVVGGLARAGLATGDLMRISGDTENATAAYLVASEMYADAIELNAAVDDYQLGFAITLVEVALSEDNVEKLTAASKVLGELAQKPENRHRINVFTALSDCYGALAAKQRDGNQAASAIEWETKAIDLLQGLVSDGGPGAALELRYALAERKCSLANLQSDRGNHTESRDTLRSANSLIEQLLAVDSTNPEYRRLYAQAQGQLGYASNQSGDKAAAKRYFETARSQWEAYIAANPQDKQAVQAFEWVKSQLEGLT
jgi:tetratricopeptide (TPR) repeat protein